MLPLPLFLGGMRCTGRGDLHLRQDSVIEVYLLKGSV